MAVRTIMLYAFISYISAQSRPLHVLSVTCGCLGGAVVRALDFRSSSQDITRAPRSTQPSIPPGR